MKIYFCIYKQNKRLAYQNHLLVLKRFKFLRLESHFLRRYLGKGKSVESSRIQEGFEQGAEMVILDARQANLSVEQAKEILTHAAGKYPDKKLPGKVEITNEWGEKYGKVFVCMW